MRVEHTRDLIILSKGNTCAAMLSPALATGSWSGGQGVAWFDSGKDEFAVTYSNGEAHGFLLWGSDEDSDKYISSTRYQPNYRFGVVGFGGWLISTKTFEKYTWASRQTTTNVPLVYKENDLVYFSLRGYITKEDEWTLSGDPRAPNTNVVGLVGQPPASLAEDYITLQIRL